MARSAVLASPVERIPGAARDLSRLWENAYKVEWISPSVLVFGPSLLGSFWAVGMKIRTLASHKGCRAPGIDQIQAGVS